MPGGSCSWPTQNELNGIFIDFWSHFVLLVQFCLIGIFLIYTDFCFVGDSFVHVSCFVALSLCLFVLKKDKKTKIRWVKKWKGSGRNWGQRKT